MPITPFKPFSFAPNASGAAHSVPSPCINVCVMDAHTGWCTGCLRTMEEIVQWGNSSTEVKRAVLAQLPARQEQLFP